MQHFRGRMDHWDPIVTDGFASGRPVILFDNAGVASSSGVDSRLQPGLSLWGPQSHQNELPGGHRLRRRDSKFGMGSRWSPIQVRPADRPEPQLYATIRRSMTVLGCVKIGLPASPLPYVMSAMPCGSRDDGGAPLPGLPETLAIH